MKRDIGSEAAAAANERDLATLRRLRSEAGAFEALYREFYPRLFDFLLRMLGSPRDVEEAINDTMLVVWRKADGFAERSKVSTWIFGIAYKKALKRLQWNRRLAEREVQVDIEAVSPHDPVEIVGDEAFARAHPGSGRPAPVGAAQHRASRLFTVTATARSRKSSIAP